ncbi:hypothetical protein, partial [Sphingobium cupriresistens]|uniref:hypothetical protein n=1 Tax=Sphingobium cupriresistens TaxID=1132417 RepID=UPI001A915592
PFCHRSSSSSPGSSSHPNPTRRSTVATLSGKPSYTTPWDTTDHIAFDRHMRALSAAEWRVRVRIRIAGALRHKFTLILVCFEILKMPQNNLNFT